MRRLAGIMLVMVLVAGTGASAAEPPPNGQEIYASLCADCHRTNGEGLAAAFPALKGNAMVTGEAGPVIQVILEGRKGAVGRMPSWKNRFSDPQVAAVVTYIRQAWGNKGTPVTPEMVAPLRK